jgi:hypothetical protein
MIKKISGESWSTIHINDLKKLRRKYAVSSLGRAASFTEDVTKDGKLLTGSITAGYRTLNLHLEKGNGTIYFHREVAKLFCKKPSAKHKYVIHLNHKKIDNNYANLRWATLEEVAGHQQSSPQKIANKKRQATKQ